MAKEIIIRVDDEDFDKKISDCSIEDLENLYKRVKDKIEQINLWRTSFLTQFMVSKEEEKDEIQFHQSVTKINSMYLSLIEEYKNLLAKIQMYKDLKDS